MATPQLDRLKSQLLTSGLQQKDNPLWQVINQLIDILRASNIAITELENADSGSGITQLTGDVAAGPGTGSQVATIQPLAVTTGKIANDAITTAKILDSQVTYEKIQDTAGFGIALGRGSSGPGVVQEIAMGANVEISGTTLNVKNDQGGIGLNHDLLSETHPDTIPASPIAGDLIWAEQAAEIEPPNIQGYVVSRITEDLDRIIRPSYMGGSNSFSGSGKIAQMTGLAGVEFIETPVYHTPWSSFCYFPPSVTTRLTEVFSGIRPVYQGFNSGLAGNGPFMMGYDSLEFVSPEEYPLIGDTGLWTRLPKGTEGQVLGMLLGIPQYMDNIDIPGDIRADTGDIVAGGTVSGTTLIGLGSVTAPIGTFSAGAYVNGHATAIGEWVDVAFNAANFTANGGTTPTWTLTAPDQVCFRYALIGNILKVQVYLATTTVASAAGNVTELRIKIPAGFTAVGQPAQMVGAQENSVAVFDVYATTEPSTDATVIFIRTFPIGGGGGRPFNQTADASYFGFTIDIRIA